jgi:CRISPR-associated protein Csm4
MNLYRLKLHPHSAWLTPWQADTLSGVLCWIYVRTFGDDALKRDVIEPALKGEPLFVLSDAFPGDLLPVPACLRLRDWPAEDRKEVKRARWLRTPAFQSVQSASDVEKDELLLDDAFHNYVQVRNTLDRFTNTTGAAGSLFSLGETVLNEKSNALGNAKYLSVYARVTDGFEQTLLALFEQSACVGFGADVSVGKGQFDVVSSLERVETIDRLGVEANGMICLSTFQPAINDPAKGLWDAFTKFGKIGPDFGLENAFKRPLIMLRPGACFYGEPRDFVGRAVPMAELLSPASQQQLTIGSVNLVQYAFGVTVPAQF